MLLGLVFPNQTEIYKTYKKLIRKPSNRYATAV
jgi:hypothetical protein